MQLKKVEIKGFKSFADKTTLEFPMGVTAVVGPNGSGKSNIIEAIRWAMGEQSAKSLRGGKMNDIIFSGTSTRKPVNIAEVTLHFDNKDNFFPVDYDEIMISRRLHRNGESDYAINRKSCRLKDIVDLFTDSGLGKDSFSIISQGQVENVFNSKPEERRAIFEEAAGVLKYKTRKKKAEEKLVATEDNLFRVNDILKELDRQIKPLEIQKNTAKEYLNLENQLKELDISVTVQEIQKKKDEWNKNKNESKNHLETQQYLNKQINDKKQSSVELTESLQDIEKEREEIQQRLMDQLRQKEQLTGEKNLYHERKKFAKNTQTKNIHEKQKLKEEYTDLLDIQSQLKEKWTEKQKVVKDNERQVSDLKKKVERLSGDKKEVIENLRSLYIEKMQASTSLTNEEQYIKKTLSQLTIQVQKKESLIQEIKNKIEEQQRTIKSLKDEEKENAVSIKKQLDSYQNIKEKRDHEYVIFNQETEVLSQLEEHIQKRSFEKKHLENWQANYEGLYSGVRTVLKNKEQLTGILGIVAELIEVKPVYQTAIDTALGSSGQFVAVSDEQAAKEAIQFLKQKKAGRATFLPLTTVQERRVSKTIFNKIVTTDGYIGLASEVISFDQMLSPVIQNILGTTIIAKNLDNAIAIAKVADYRYKVVTLEGDQVNAGGSLTGGGRKHKQSQTILSTKNDIQKITQEIKTFRLKKEEQKRIVQTHKEKIQKMDQRLEEVRTRGEELRVEQQNLLHSIESNETDQHRLERELKANEYELSNFQKEKMELQSKESQMQVEKRSVDKEVQQLKEEIESWSKDSSDKEKLHSKLNEELEVMREELFSLKEQAGRVEQEIYSNEKQLERYRENMKVLDQEIQKNKNIQEKSELPEIEQKLNQLTIESQNNEKTLTHLTDKKQKIEAKIKETNEELNHFQSEKEKISKQEAMIDVTLNRLDVQLDHLLNHLSETYQLSFEAANELANLSLSLNESKPKLKELRQKIKMLGPINLDAIEEFEAVSERFNFLSEQKTDLVEAKEQLIQTMHEMDEEVRSRFKETFEKIQSSFEDIFPKMFGGGHARISLTNPSDLLTSGIEITAQPPGKKLQHLSLLSGGERSLTAIALLFSIIQVRPVPFCILDEAEAALDDANIARFGNFLRSFNGEPQFIVITHRKGTMEKADTLYGVTMQEKGVSKLVSVRLNEEKHFSHS